MTIAPFKAHSLSNLITICLFSLSREAVGELFRNLDSEGVRRHLQTLCKEYNGRKSHRSSGARPVKRRKRVVVENKNKASRKEADENEK